MKHDYGQSGSPLTRAVGRGQWGATMGDAHEVRELVRRVAQSNDSGELEACYRAVSFTLQQENLLIPTGILDADAIPSQILRERERLLGAATLAAEILLRLLPQAQKSGAYIVHHTPSFSAQDKQIALGFVCDAFVLKTVTVRFSDCLVFCSGSGDFTLPRSVLRKIGHGLDLSRSEQRNVSINPGDVVPETSFGLLRGMVSPFLPRMPLVQLVSIFLLAPDRDDNVQEVAIPISPCESLIVPTKAFALIVKNYVAHHLPTVCVMDIPPLEPAASKLTGKQC